MKLDVIQHLLANCVHLARSLSPFMGHFWAKNDHFHHILDLLPRYLDSQPSLTILGLGRMQYNIFWPTVCIWPGHWAHLWANLGPKMAIFTIIWAFYQVILTACQMSAWLKNWGLVGCNRAYLGQKCLIITIYWTFYQSLPDSQGLEPPTSQIGGQKNYRATFFLTRRPNSKCGSHENPDWMARN